MTGVRNDLGEEATASERGRRGRDGWTSTPALLALDEPVRCSPPPSDRWATAESTVPQIEESHFVVLESGRIRFFAQLPARGSRGDKRVASPSRFALLPRPYDVPRRADARRPRASGVRVLSFLLAPRSRALVRRVIVVDRTMPDPRVAERRRAYVERIGSAEELARAPYLLRGGRRSARHPPTFELAGGTYAIAAHRDHVHLLYELEPVVGDGRDDLEALRAELCIAPRGSLVTAVYAVGRGRVGPFEPALLDREGVELVFSGGAGARPVPSAGSA